MNVSRYISKKITASASESFTSSVTKIAIISIAIGLAIMIVSFAILEGFRNQIQDKIFSFGAHLQITKYDTNNSLEGLPISTNTGLSPHKNNVPGIAHMQPFARKTAIVKTEGEVLGVVLKGIDQTYDLSAMERNLVAGRVLQIVDSVASDEVMVSKKIADQLRLEIGEEALFYFVQNPPRVRKFKIVGIYKTGLDEFDNVYVFSDLEHIRDLNNWNDTLVGGYEIILKDFRTIDQTAHNVFDKMNYDLQLQKITDEYAQLFDWLKLLKRNVIIFLVLIVFVATFNMVSTVFIMIMERTHMIGVLKAVGATNYQIRKIFFYNGAKLTFKGLLWGNVVGLGFCAIQYYFQLIPLDPENYYMDTVPIHWNFGVIMILNAAIFLLTLLSVLLPTALVSRIKPVKAIRFD
ncbi:ABC transporter permease [Adhaeribacter sp. BT258]|uniref:ABC transporter permease n=1 Tax=Adhaeribacter terrigena TaxID=2793070 RepID=A0ABS1C7B4_9BACT|nr:FtsX-like permease family protein [Adhaeribacter terrigena]MBK0404583.1 ABC transporter permease [Adhaeribacter terrigena]